MQHSCDCCTWNSPACTRRQPQRSCRCTPTAPCMHGPCAEACLPCMQRPPRRRCPDGNYREASGLHRRQRPALQPGGAPWPALVPWSVSVARQSSVLNASALAATCSGACPPVIQAPAHHVVASWLAPNPQGPSLSYRCTGRPGPEAPPPAASSCASALVIIRLTSKATGLILRSPPCPPRAGQPDPGAPAPR